MNFDCRRPEWTNESILCDGAVCILCIRRVALAHSNRFENNFQFRHTIRMLLVHSWYIILIVMIAWSAFRFKYRYFPKKKIRWIVLRSWHSQRTRDCCILKTHLNDIESTLRTRFLQSTTAASSSFSLFLLLLILLRHLLHCRCREFVPSYSFGYDYEIEDPRKRYQHSINTSKYNFHRWQSNSIRYVIEIVCVFFFSSFQINLNSKMMCGAVATCARIFRMGNFHCTWFTPNNIYAFASI